MKTQLRFFSLLICFVLIFSSVIFPVVIYAGFTDEWISQKTVSSPTHVYGRDRNYFTAGGFSARWRNSVDHPISIQMPRLRGGCGGIDVFMGGISFLNFDFIVNKLQRILQSAPGFAFDIALKTFFPSGSESLGKMEGIVNALNSVQLDDCKGGKALATFAANSISDKLATKGERDAAVKDYWTSTGIGDLYQKGTDLINSLGKRPPPGAGAKNRTEGCPTELKELLDSGSVLEKVAAKRGITNPDSLAQLRGIYGDVSMEVRGEDILTRVIQPCPQNNIAGLDSIVWGEVWMRPVGAGSSEAACVPQNDANKSLYALVKSNISEAHESFIKKGKLRDEVQNFLASMPVSSYIITRTAVQTGVNDGILGPFTIIASYSLASELLKDMNNETLKIIRGFEAAVDAAAETADPVRCQLVEAASMVAKVQELRETILQHRNNVPHQFKEAMSQLDSNMKYMRMVRDFKIVAERSLKRRALPTRFLGRR